MKRIIHVLAALWPERREYYNTWLPDARNGLLRHAVAVLRVEHAMEELALCKEPKAQPANTPDTETSPQANNEPNNRLNLTSRLAGRRITVPGSSEIASLPAKAHLRIRVFANLPLVPAQIKAFIGQGPLRIEANQRISGLAKTNLFTRSQTPLNPGYSLVFAITILFMCLLSAQRVSAQAERSGVPNAFGAEPASTATNNIQPLQIGDPIPDEVWNLPLQVVNHPEGKETITLADYKGKLIILDFWATWCVPCIKSMYKLDTLQQGFHKDVVILPVTYESSSRAMNTFVNHGWRLPTLVGDTHLKHYFPHTTMPHHVWVKDGSVLASTYPEYATEVHIESVLNGKEINMPPKELFAGMDIIQPVDTLYQLVITKRNEILNAGFRRRSNGFSAINLAIPALYRSAFRSSLPYSGWLNRIVVDVDSISLPFIQRPANNLSGDYHQDSLLLQWNADNTYCYVSLFSHSVGHDVLYGQMQRDLNTFFGNFLGIEGRMEKRNIQCLVLRANGNTPAYMDAGSQSRASKYTIDRQKLVVENYPMDDFVDRLATANRHLPTPLVNGTAYQGSVNIEINADLQDIQNVNRQLAPYGLELKKEYYDVDVLVIAAINKTN